MERTFIMLKPDALERALVGTIIQRFERKGLKPTRFLSRVLSNELTRRHYAALVDKPYFNDLQEYMTRGLVLTTIWEGRDAVAVARETIGATDPSKAGAGTIRGDFGRDVMENLVHASDSAESAEREIALFFDDAIRS